MCWITMCVFSTRLCEGTMWPLMSGNKLQGTNRSKNQQKLYSSYLLPLLSGAQSSLRRSCLKGYFKSKAIFLAFLTSWAFPTLNHLVRATWLCRHAKRLTRCRDKGQICRLNNPSSLHSPTTLLQSCLIVSIQILFIYVWTDSTI